MITDPFLRQLVERSIRGGNPTLQSDLDPATGLKRRTFPDPNAGIEGGIAMGSQATPDPLEAHLTRLLSEKPGFSDRFQLAPVPMPSSENQRDVGARSFLSGAVHGVNARFGNKAANKESTIANLLRLAEMKRYHDAQIGNMGADNTRADKLAGNTISNTGADNTRADANLQRALEALAESERSHRANEGLRGQSLAITVRGQDLSHGDRQQSLALARQREARRGQVAAMYPKWSPQMKAEHDAEVRSVFTQYGKDGDPDARDAALDEIAGRYLQKSQHIGNPFIDNYLPESAPVTTGRSSTAPALKPSDNPALDAKTRAYWKARGF